VNVPIGLVVFLMGRKHLPAGAGSKEKMDYRGAVLQFAGTLLFFGAFIEAQKIGLENPYILTAILLAAVLIGLFLRSESRQEQPLLQLGIFHSRLFSLGLICAFISYICIAASTILLPFYFQDTMKMSPSATGFFLMLSPLIIAVLSPFCGAISDRIGSELLTLFGLLLMSFGFFLMSFLRENSPLVCAAMFVAVMAVGQSFFQPANNSLIMSACPKERLGIAGSVNSLMRNLGQIVGITLSTTFLYSFMSQKLHYRVADYVPGRDDVFIYGMKNDYFILAALCFAGACVTSVRLFSAGKKQREQKAAAD
jgi:MFS family permease